MRIVPPSSWPANEGTFVPFIALLLVAVGFVAVLLSARSGFRAERTEAKPAASERLPLMTPPGEERRFCHYCGAENPGDAGFCGICGKRLR